MRILLLCLMPAALSGAWCDRGQLFLEGFGLSALCAQYAENYNDAVTSHEKIPEERAGVRLLDSATRWYGQIVDRFEGAVSSSDIRELSVLDVFNKQALYALEVCFESDRLCLGVREVLKITADVIKNAWQDRILE